MPVYGRVELTRICLRQLRRTCVAMADYGLDARAIVVGEDHWDALGFAERLGFGTVVRNNEALARKFNDGLQLACDPALNPEPADFAVPIGSDDWVDPALFNQPMPRGNTLLAFRDVAFVNETGTELTETRLAYEGGVGIRVYPRGLLEPSGYRPADEDRKKACDTSILYNTRRALLRQGKDLAVRYGDLHPRQIVDWKTPGVQMNSYETIAKRHRGRQVGDPFELLEGVFPAEALAEMRAHYGR